jgi:hypothetical protein
MPQIPLTNFPPNNQNLFQQCLPRQAVRPPPLDPLTLPPASPHFQPPNFDPSLQLRDQPILPDPPVFQPAPQILPPIDFCLPLRPMPQLLACNFPPLPEPALPAHARPMAVPHLPPLPYQLRAWVSLSHLSLSLILLSHLPPLPHRPHSLLRQAHSHCQIT